MKPTKLSEKITAKQFFIFLIILVIAIAIAFVAINWNIFAESFQVGWNSR